MDAVYIERQKFESLTFAKKEFVEKYELCVSDKDFGIDPATGLHFMEPDIIDNCKNDHEVQFLLDRELEILKEDQATLRMIMANREKGRESDPMSYAPGNIQRVIMNATQQFRIDQSQPSDLHPKNIIKKINSLLQKLVVVHGFDSLSMEAQKNATTAYEILIRSTLATKRVLLEFRLNEVSLDWIIGEIEHRFHRAKVNPLEMAGVLAAQSIGEPTTQMTLNVSILLSISWLELFSFINTPIIFLLFHIPF
jgi:DNA-directed RNA polymerase II subunit RPB1